jgi:hypothetical protein
MRKNLLFGWMVLMLVIVSGFKTQAQTWTAPTLTGSDLVSGTTYYVYNVGSNGYLNRGGEWAMHAVVTAQPKANASATIIKWTAVNTTDSTWTLQYNSGGSNVAGKYLFAADVNGGWTYTDNSSNNTWYVVLRDAPTKKYSIQVVSTYGGYNSAQYLGSASATETTNKGIANPVRYNRASGDNYTQWKFVSQADMDLYNARVLLDRYMNYVKKRGGFDLSSYITTYNAGVTADINKAAATLLAALGKTSVTVPNFSFETDASQTGWTNSGSFVNQTNTPLFTKDGTNYTEKYTGSGGNLATGTITQTVSGLANGLYGLVATGHAVQQAGGNPLHTGAFFKAGTDSTEISSGGDYNVDYAIVSDATSGSNGTLTIGYALSGTVACNWTGFDNFRLYYYGDGAIPPKILLSPASLTFLSAGTKKVGVTGNSLTNTISITAPANFSVSPSTLAATVNGDSVAITYDGGATTSGYVVFTSGAVKDSVQVTGTANPIITTTPSSLTLDDLHLTGSFTVNGLNLTSDITITTPAGITVNPATISKTSASNVTIAVTYDGVTTPVSGDIVVTSGTLVKNVAVTAFSSAACFTPLYASGNMIADPTFNAATLSDGGFEGWGPTAITHTRQYCGRGAAYIRGTCYPDGGSINRSLNSANGNALKPNSKYRLRAMINSQASGGKTFQFEIEGVNGTASQYFQIGNTNGWKQFDTTFVTGATVTEKGIYFNSCYNNGAVAPPITDTCFIDNYELYDITQYIPLASLSNLTVDGTKVAGFDSTVYTYDVISPAIPTVAAVAAVAGATVNITQATTLPGTAIVKVTSPDGTITNTYTINITAHSTDASLSALTVSSGTLKPVFNAATLKYYVELPAGSAIPTVTATTNHVNATAVVTPATSVPDTTIVKVTAEDGTTTKTYMVNMWDAKLTGTVIGHASSWNNDPATYIAAAFDGNTSTFVDAPTATGYVGYDFGAGKKAKVTSMRYFPRTTHASRMVGGEIRGANKADLSDSVVLYKITATPSTVTYTDVILNVAKSYQYIYYYSADGYCNIAELELYGVIADISSDATLSALTVSAGALSPAFDAGTTTYSVVLPAGTTTIPTISATTNEAHAITVITQATSVTGSGTVLVTAQDETTTKTYTVNFSLAAAPVAPVASAATSVAKTSFVANWAASTGATGYFLDVATDNAFTTFVTGYNNKDVANVTTYSVTGLTAATTYYYRVRATNGTVSANSNTITVLSLGTGVQSLATNGLGIAVKANAVELESGNAIVSVQVVSVNGKLMTEKSVNATKATISTEGWASGIYVFTIKTQDQVTTTKLGIVK